MQDETNKDILKLGAKRNPSEFLNKKPPLLIDEWQEILLFEIPLNMRLINEIKKTIILTGSTMPTIIVSKTIQELVKLMNLWSLYEFLEWTGNYYINSRDKSLSVWW